MKHIGIVDITTVGACICANEIVAEAFRRDPAGRHPEFTIHSFSFELYKQFILRKDWQGLAEIILSSIHKLQKVGADFIIIPSNTPHYSFAEISKSSPLPVLNLIDLTAEKCQRKHYKKVAVLGTSITMQDGLYDQPLRQRQITPVIPDPEGCFHIHNLIMDALVPGKANRQAVARQVAENFIKKIECDAIILGCTELPEVYDEKNLGKPVIDTTRLLAHKALDYAV